MQVIADAAGMEMHTAKLSMLPEPKLTIPKLIAIAFIKFHREIKKRNKQLVEADFNVLRLERDDARHLDERGKRGGQRSGWSQKEEGQW